MDDSQFTNILNRLSHEKRIDIRRFHSKTPKGADVSSWVDLLQSAIREGVALSDPRWRRLTVENRRDRTVFALRAADQTEPDEDFRLGLQLFMTILGEEDTE